MSGNGERRAAKEGEENPDLTLRPLRGSANLMEEEGVQPEAGSGIRDGKWFSIWIEP